MTNNNKKKNNSRMILIFNFFKPINLNSQKSGLHAFIINIKTILYFLYLRQSSSCSWVTQMNFILTRNNQLTNMAKRILFLMYIWKHPAATFCCRTVHYIYICVCLNIFLFQKSWPWWNFILKIEILTALVNTKLIKVSIYRGP